MSQWKILNLFYFKLTNVYFSVRYTVPNLDRAFN